MPPKSKVNYDDVTTLFNQGAALSEIAHKYNANPESIRQGLKRRGIKTVQRNVGLEKTVVPQDIAYIAGLLDGEESINIHVNPKRQQYSLSVTITSTCKRIIDWLLATVGGHSRTIQYAQKKRLYHWTVTFVQAAQFLELVKLFLKIKSGGTDVAIQFQNRLKSCNHLSEDEIESRKELKNKLESLR